VQKGYYPFLKSLRQPKYNLGLLGIVIIINPFKKFKVMEKVKVQATLVSVANNALSFVNAKGNTTYYRKCVVNLNNEDYFAKIWEKSFQLGITIGNEYAVEIQLDDEGKYWLTVLNGNSAKIATAEDFAHLFAGLTV
jgi:hypothetical protein